MKGFDERVLRRSLEHAAQDADGAVDPQTTWQRASRRADQLRRRRQMLSVASGVVALALVGAAALTAVLGGVPESEEPAGEVAEEADEPAADQADQLADDVEDSDEEAVEEELATVPCADEAAGFTVQLPADWHTEPTASDDPCRLFGPQPFEVGEAIGGGDPDGDVRIYLDVLMDTFDAYVERSLEGRDDLVDRTDTTVDGRRAVRWEAISTGQGLLPEGTHSTGWVVEVDEGLVVTLSTNDAAAPEEYEQDVEVLDAVARSISPVD